MLLERSLDVRVPKAVSRVAPRANKLRAAAGLWLGLLAATAGLSGCKLFLKEKTEDKYPKMTPEAEAVRIYFSGEQPECQEILNLGQVQAKAGDFPDPDPQFISPQVNMDIALAWLKVEAAKRGANGVRLLEQKGNHDGTLHIAIGEAIFCKKAY